MGPRIRRLSAEVARFSAVNVVATAVAVFLFNMIVHGVKGWFDGPLHGHVILAYLMANSVGMFVSFYGSRHYAFRHRHAAGPGGGMPTYVAINLASFVIPVSCLWVTRNVFGWDTIYADNMSGNVVGALLGNAYRFWAFRRFVFHMPSAAPRSFWDTPPPDDARHADLSHKHDRDDLPDADLSEVDP